MLPLLMFSPEKDFTITTETEDENKVWKANLLINTHVEIVRCGKRKWRYRRVRGFMLGY